MTEEGRSLTLLDPAKPIVLSTKRDELLLRLESFKVNNFTAKELEEFKRVEINFARDFLWTAEYFLGIYREQVGLLLDDQIEELDKLILERVSVWWLFFPNPFTPPYIFRYRGQRRKFTKMRGKDYFPIRVIREIIPDHRYF